MINKLFTEFHCGYTNINFAKRPGHRKEVASKKIIDKIHDMALGDRWLKTREMSDIVKIATERVFHISHECLGMRKLLAR